MCIADNVIVTELLTWREAWVYGRCKNCVPENIRKVKVAYSSWQNGEIIQEKRKKQGYCKGQEGIEG